MEYNEKEIRELYATLKSVKAVKKKYNRGKVRKEQISLAGVERIVGASRDHSSELPGGMLLIIIGIFASSLMHIFTLAVQKTWYWEIHGHLSDSLITLRYLFSFSQRFFGIAVGIGVLCLKDLSRKLLICLGIFSILVLPWKHSYDGFVTHTAILDEKLSGMLSLVNGFGRTNFSFSNLVIPSMLGHWVADASFWCLVFWYFTRPKIKELF